MPFGILAIASTAAALPIAGLLVACGQPPPAAEAPAARRAVDLTLDVSTTRVWRGSIVEPISAPGTLVAHRESRIGTEVRGRIERIHVSEGDRVEAGAPLFEVDPSAYEMAVRQATAGLDVANAKRHQIESDLARARKLEKDNVIPAQEIERIQTSLHVARAHVRQADEAVALARYNLEQTIIRAPYSGSIAARLADEGTTAVVRPQTIVVVLQETVELEARATIPESQLASVHVGDPAQISIEGIPDPIRAQISAVSDTIDPATRTYLVKMRVPNPDHAIKAGVFAHIEILPSAKTDVLLVPRIAIRSEDGRTRVLLVEDGRAIAVPVQLGIVSEDNAEVLAGLDEGDQVIVGKEAGIIAPGMRVRVSPVEPTPSA